MAPVRGTYWLLLCYMHVIVLIVQVRVSVGTYVKSEYLLWCVRAHVCVCMWESMGLLMQIMNPITQTHPLRCPWWQSWSSVSDCRWRWWLWRSSCTQTPPAPCTACGSSSHSLSKPKNAQHVRTGTGVSLTSTNLLRQTFLWTQSILQMQLSDFCMLTVRQTNSSQIYWGEGAKLWF